MRQDVLNALSGIFPSVIPSKETLNHPGIIEQVTGMDVYQDTARAFERAWNSLGIDIHVPCPVMNAAPPKVTGGTWEDSGYVYNDYGVYPTRMATPRATVLDRDFFEYDGAYPVKPPTISPPQSSHDLEWVYTYDVLHHHDFDLEAESRALEQTFARFNNTFGQRAVLYQAYYTTLFMWPVLVFDWQPFMMAAALDPDRFDRRLWEPWAAISRKRIEALASRPEDVVFCHDDIAIGTGLVFHPEFYETYIFPRYEWILEPALQAGKKIVFICDGNLDPILERLLELPFDAIQYENPATPFGRVLETWGEAGRGFIGGIETGILTNGTPETVRHHTRAVIEAGSRYPGFIISSCGQLPGSIPQENIVAYFETRNEMGIPAEL